MNSFDTRYVYTMSSEVVNIMSCGNVSGFTVDDLSITVI